MSHLPGILMFSLEYLLSNQHFGLVILNNNHTNLGLLPASVVILPTIVKHFDWSGRMFHFSSQRIVSHFFCSVLFELFPTTEHMEG